MGWQDALTFLAVAIATVFLGYKFALEPRLRSRRPDVAARALVRRNRPTSQKPDDCCH